MHIYFLGIGGVAIGPLARLARDAGHNVSGSDMQASRYTESVKKDGIPVQIGSSVENIASIHAQRPIDWVVYTAAVPISSVELQFARDRGIRTSKRDVLINHVLKEHELKMIAVTGTHGKTNSTGMLIWICQQLKVPVSWSIGTNISFGQNGHYDPDSDFLIYEADEFDRNFLNFDPAASIIPSVDYDHPDTYPTVDEYKQAFADFVRQSKKTFLWPETEEYLELDNKEILRIADEDTDWSEYKIPGDKNRRNAVLVTNLIEEVFGKKRSKILAALEKFPGTERRLERIANNIISDYAHHPAEIRATIQAAKEINQRVIVVYQPHQNKRQKDIKDLYKNSFDGAEKVFWLPTYLSRESAEDIISPDVLIRALDNPDIAQKAEMGNDLSDTINRYRNEDALVVLMSAGDLDAWARTQFTS